MESSLVGETVPFFPHTWICTNSHFPLDKHPIPTDEYLDTLFTANNCDLNMSLPILRLLQYWPLNDELHSGGTSSNHTVCCHNCCPKQFCTVGEVVFFSLVCIPVSLWILYRVGQVSRHSGDPLVAWHTHLPSKYFTDLASKSKCWAFNTYRYIKCYIVWRGEYYSFSCLKPFVHLILRLDKIPNVSG